MLAGEEWRGKPRLAATVRLFRAAFFRKVITCHDTGMGESYMDGDWEVRTGQDGSNQAVPDGHVLKLHLHGEQPARVSIMMRACKACEQAGSRHDSAAHRVPESSEHHRSAVAIAVTQDDA